MIINGIEKLSLVDYDGYTSATLFSGNCNFRCPFCHNSALVNDFNSQPVLDNSEILDFLRKRYGMLEAVVVSGGEPTLQKDLADFVSQIKAIGYKVKLDTNGTNPDVVEHLIDAKLVDYVAMDVKNSPLLYPTTCGVQSADLNKIQQSIKLLLEGAVDYEFRTTLVKELHTQQSIAQLGDFVRGAKRLFLQKFVDRGGCIQSGLHEVDEQTAKHYLSLIADKVDYASLRGY